MIRKNIALIVMLLFIGMIISPSSSSIIIEQVSESTSSDKTLYVGGSGPGNYTSIQDAIDNSSDGDTVFVYKGTYYENLDVFNSIKLIGEDKNTTIIDGSYNYERIIYFWDDNITITGFTIQNSQYHGIGIDSSNFSGGYSHGNIIYGNNIKNIKLLGIAIISSWRNIIYRNNITNNRYGIYVAGFYGDASYNCIYQNNIMNNNHGIVLEPNWQGNTNDNIIYQNNFFSNHKNAWDRNTNKWDNGKVGNYWDDYKGKDMDDDGIGDKPYRIGPFVRVTKDNYPLMKPYGNITCYPKNSQSITTSSGQSNNSIIPSIGNLQVNNDTTPPVTTHSLNSPEPDGDNGWYVSDVEVTLNATDNESGVDRIEYRIEGGSWVTIQGDNGTFEIDENGNDILIEYYAIDNAGNEEEIKSFTLDMDQWVPIVNDVTGGAFKKNGLRYVRFLCYAVDKTSGMDRVEFHIDGEHRETIKGSGPEYGFIIQWSEFLNSKTFFFYHYDKAGNKILVVADSQHYQLLGTTIIGFICNPEISDHNISFFAVAVLEIDYVGDCIPEREISISILKHFTFLNNYNRYIGKNFICATFFDWYP